jgi:hypothetical protein
MAELKHTEDSSASGICKNCNNHIREKLVELIDESGACFNCFPCEDYEKEEKYKIADHLIAHGVTVQEWIPVTERLPENSGKYLVAGRQFREQKYQVWICEFLSLGLFRGWSNHARNPIVEMWMPLPQPPKGE